MGKKSELLGCPQKQRKPKGSRFKAACMRCAQPQPHASSICHGPALMQVGSYPPPASRFNGSPTTQLCPDLPDRPGAA